MVIVSYWKCWKILPEIKRLHPNIKLIFINTYVSELGEIAQLEGADVVLRAPCDAEETKRILA